MNESVISRARMSSWVPSGETDVNRASPTEIVTLKSTWCHQSSSCSLLTKRPKVAETSLNNRISISTGEELLTEVDSLQDVEKEIVEGEKEIREEIEVDKKECEKLCGGYEKVARLKNDLVERGKQKIKRQNERRKQTKKSIKFATVRVSEMAAPEREPSERTQAPHERNFRIVF